MDVEKALMDLVKAQAITTTNVNNLTEVIKSNVETTRQHSEAFVLLNKNCRLLKSGNGNGNGNGDSSQKKSFLMTLWDKAPDTVKTVIIVMCAVEFVKIAESFIETAKKLSGI